MKFNRFEELPIWIESRAFVNDIFKLLLVKNRIDYSIADQLKRASYSIMLNIAEGFERGSNKEFANFINIAKGSAGEVRAILYIMKDNKLIEDGLFNDLLVKIEHISVGLSGFRTFLLKTHHKQQFINNFKS